MAFSLLINFSLLRLTASSSYDCSCLSLAFLDSCSPSFFTILIETSLLDPERFVYDQRPHILLQPDCRIDEVWHVVDDFDEFVSRYVVASLYLKNFNQFQVVQRKNASSVVLLREKRQNVSFADDFVVVGIDDSEQEFENLVVRQEAVVKYHLKP